MHYFKSLIPAIFSVIIANAQLSACGTCGGCCNGKNSGKAIEAAMQQASWLSDWMTAKKFVKEKDFKKGIEHYTSAIKSLRGEETRVLSFGLFNERAAVYMAAGEMEKAIVDYEKVIQKSEGVTQDVLDAHLGRIDACLKLNQVEKCQEDMDFLTKYDPNFPRISREGDFVVISNFDSDQMSKKETKAFKKFHVKVGICEFADDIIFLPGKKYIIRSPLTDGEALKKLAYVYGKLLKKYSPKVEFPRSVLKLPS